MKSLFALGSFALASATTINEITGTKFLSPLVGQVVTNVTGLITAKASNGIYLRSTTPDSDPRSSNSIFVFSSSVGKTLAVGDIINLGGNVAEFRSTATYLLTTEITSPKNVTVISSGNPVTPLVIGKDTLSPPTQQFTSLDDGDVFGLPNNISQVSNANPVLEPAKYGLDFWESLTGELVTVRKPKAITRPNSFRDTWVVGDWKVTGRNKRGGLTMTDKDANPEAVMIIDPLDGTKNPTETRIGDDLEEITGVVTFAFGYYCIAPLTALKITGSASPAAPPPTTLTTTGSCKDLTFGSYNVENLDPSDAHLPKVAAHIVNYLKTPTLVFLQEIQDNNGATNDAVVDANVTLSTLVSEISKISSVNYAFADIDPEDDKDGGEPGGNIRVAYLYNPTIIRLHKPNPGGSTDANDVLPGAELKYNPGRIDPLNVAWNSSRKPLVAAWETLNGKNKFFTINVHFASKGGSSPIEGDARPPVNGVVDPRIQQATLTADFITKILHYSPLANIITAGDFNEFAFAAPLETFVRRSFQLDLDAVALIPPVERYTYTFDMNCQQLDHMFVSPAIAAKALLGKVKYEHIHVNTWATAADVVSDHDPSVAKLDVCSIL